MHKFSFIRSKHNKMGHFWPFFVRKKSHFEVMRKMKVHILTKIEDLLAINWNKGLFRFPCISCKFLGHNTKKWPFSDIFRTKKINFLSDAQKCIANILLNLNLHDPSSKISTHYGPHPWRGKNGQFYCKYWNVQFSHWLHNEEKP